MNPEKPTTSTIKTAIVSVSDKTNLLPLCQALIAAQITIYASDGSASFLKKNGLAAKRIEELTGQAEMMDGRVKTLHPKVHGGILLRRNLTNDINDAQQFNITGIDLVVVNLYPFTSALQKIEDVNSQASEKKNTENANSLKNDHCANIKNNQLLLGGQQLNEVAHDEALDQVDIGGVTLLRAAAKNHKHVTVVCQPSDYQLIIQRVEQGKTPSTQEKLRLAALAFETTAHYDAAIAAYFSRQASDETSPLASKNFFVMESQKVLRYGENPHENGVLFSLKEAGQMAACAKTDALTFNHSKILHGKEMSYNNYLDAFEAAKTVYEFSHNAVAVVKHLNPCGLATSTKENAASALKHAMQGDIVSSYGSIIATNTPFTKGCVDVLGKLFVEIIVAPSFEQEALAALKRKSKNLRLLQMPSLVKKNNSNYKSHLSMQFLGAHALVKQAKSGTENIDATMWENPSKKKVSASQLPLFTFAMQAVKNIKSNAIAIAYSPEDGCHMLLGMGAGQPNRVESLKLAINKAQENLLRMVGEEQLAAAFSRCTLAGDAFFPFADSIHLAGKAGIKNFVHPGGSIRDNEVIEAANIYDAVMLLSKTRFFKH